MRDATSPFSAIEHPKKRAFLAAYAEHGQVRRAAQDAEISHVSHFYWKRDDPVYAEAFAIAHQMAIVAHEDEASRRAMGWDETRYADDGTSYTIRKYSDTLLIFRLKALKPDEYRENATIRHEGEITLALEDRTRQANERLARLRRVGPDTESDQLSA